MDDLLSRLQAAMTTRRDFVRSSLLAGAATLAPTRDAFGAVPWWWAAPRRDPAAGLQDQWNADEGMVLVDPVRGLERWVAAT